MERIIISEESKVDFRRGIRLRFDKVREKWLLMAPEYVLTPDGVALDILKKIDGDRSVAMIIDELAREYEGSPEEITTDILEFLQAISDRGYLERIGQ